jgi:hypothetical protein
MHHVGNLYPLSNGVWTSDLAAAQIQPVSGRLRQIVYEFVVSQGTHGATSQEVETALRMPSQSITPRVVELRKQGLLGDSGTARMTRSGRKAIVWVACSPQQPRPGSQQGPSGK